MKHEHPINQKSLESTVYKFRNPNKYTPQIKGKNKKDDELELVSHHHMPPNVEGFHNLFSGRTVVSYNHVPEDRNPAVYHHELYHKYTSSRNENNADASALSKTGKFLRFPASNPDHAYF